MCSRGFTCSGAWGDGQYPVVWWDPRALAFDVRRGVRHPPAGSHRGPRTRRAGGRPAALSGLAARARDRARAGSAPELCRSDRHRVGAAAALAQTRPSPRSPWSKRRAVLPAQADLASARSCTPSWPRCRSTPSARPSPRSPPSRRASSARLRTRRRRRRPSSSPPSPTRSCCAPARRGVDGRCRREAPITAVQTDGSLLEGVLDLAFEEDDGWTVVDFKTQGELAGLAARYRRQVAAYASVVARVTGRPATAVLMRL